MRNFLLVLLVGSMGLLLGACARNDDEPLIPSVPISRLYVSLLEYQTDETADPYSNLLIIDPANGEQTSGSLFNSGVKEGSGIFFSPEVSRVFQGSVLDQSVILMNVTAVGIPQRSGQLINENLTAIRGLHYDHNSRNLFVANNWTPSGIYVFDNPLNRNGAVEALRYFPLNGVRPWGITMWDDNLLVVRTGESGGVNLYTDVSTKLGGTEDLTPQATLTVAGAAAIRGVAYSKTLDLLVLTEYENAQVLIFENASQLFGQAQAVISPSRVISGSNTGLSGPVDVSIDDREGSKLLYVADKRSKSILRFELSAQGNARPQLQAVLPLSPEAVFLDARGLVVD